MEHFIAGFTPYHLLGTSWLTLELLAYFIFALGIGWAFTCAREAWCSCSYIQSINLGATNTDTAFQLNRGSGS